MTDADNKSQWIHLTDEKSFSRLLYTNPVCFLTTINHTITTITPTSTPNKPKRNAMVLSWITATNNNGRFMMSVNKRRHTASILSAGDGDGGGGSGGVGGNIEFVLCVPVKGMEDLVLNVGKTSGRWGSSKFPIDHQNDDNSSPPPPSSSIITTCKPPKAKKKKFENGIDGLVAVKIGKVEEAPLNDDELFAIRGTVAHLKCKTYGIVGGIDGDAIDDEHHLILAEVVDAYVQSDYWNEEKKQFQPMKQSSGETPPPYMKFLGSQTFGYVVCDGNDNETDCL